MREVGVVCGVTVNGDAAGVPTLAQSESDSTGAGEARPGSEGADGLDRKCRARRYECWSWESATLGTTPIKRR